MAIEEKEIMVALDSIYEKVKDGIPKVSPSIEDLANDYLEKFVDPDIAVKKMINYQIAKCTTSGFLTGLGGLVTLPVTIPANVGSVLYVQMRMIAGVAYIYGYDINSDQVRTLTYACLAGISVDQIIKNAGINLGTKLTQAAINRIPGKVITQINQKVEFRLVTKAGETGIVNLSKAVPVVGGVVGGSLDLIETKAIADRACKLFAQGTLE